MQITPNSSTTPPLASDINPEYLKYRDAIISEGVKTKNPKLRQVAEGDDLFTLCNSGQIRQTCSWHTPPSMEPTSGGGIVKTIYSEPGKAERIKAGKAERIKESLSEFFKSQANQSSS